MSTLSAFLSLLGVREEDYSPTPSLYVNLRRVRWEFPIFLLSSRRGVCFEYSIFVPLEVKPLDGGGIALKPYTKEQVNASTWSGYALTPNRDDLPYVYAETLGDQVADLQFSPDHNPFRKRFANAETLTPADLFLNMLLTYLARKPNKARKS